MGVWIETEVTRLYIAIKTVTPCMGVWIETLCPWIACSSTWSHPVWVCGLKLVFGLQWFKCYMSHPVWVCGLKLGSLFGSSKQDKSHPVWVCGLKHPCFLLGDYRFRHFWIFWESIQFSNWSENAGGWCCLVGANIKVALMLAVKWRYNLVGDFTGGKKRFGGNANAYILLDSNLYTIRLKPIDKNSLTFKNIKESAG